MTYLTELEVFNDMLALLGETPLNDLLDGHPLLPAGQRALEQSNVRLQTGSWWFNKELVTLTPAPGTGHIMLPNDTLSVDPQETSLHYVQRGNRLYRPQAANLEDKWFFQAPVRCWLKRLVPFTDLPAIAQTCVAVGAQLQFSKSFDGDANKMAMLNEELRRSWVDLNAEHIRNQNINRLRKALPGDALSKTGAWQHGLWPFVS